jgi:hypothetical protein
MSASKELRFLPCDAQTESYCRCTMGMMKLSQFSGSLQSLKWDSNLEACPKPSEFGAAALTSPVPTDHRLGRNDDESLFSLRPELMHDNPEELVEQVQVWPRSAPLQHGELLAEHEVLKDQIPAVTEEANERSE